MLRGRGVHRRLAEAQPLGDYDDYEATLMLNGSNDNDETFNGKT